MHCVNGEWVPGSAPGGTGNSGGCPGFVPGMVCVNGEWTIGAAGGCPGFVPGMTCVNGEWTIVRNEPAGLRTFMNASMAPAWSASATAERRLLASAPWPQA
jgi:hypothetical protein